MKTRQTVTHAIAREVCTDLQNILWELVIERTKQAPDKQYHLFQLSVEYAFGEMFQKIVHCQPPSEYNRIVYYRYVSKPITSTICVYGVNNTMVMCFVNNNGNSAISL